jgi:hypothetical protein
MAAQLILNPGWAPLLARNVFLVQFYSGKVAKAAIDKKTVSI